jgi:hypothetical protein
MNIEKLIHWLSSHRIEVLEDRTLADGSRIITFTASLPFGEIGWAARLVSNHSVQKPN